jgi:spermidine synthase
MPPHEIIASGLTPDHEALTLTVEHGDHVVRVRGELLMSSRLTGSEQAMARLACSELAMPRAPRALIAGLGMGFTLRALLDEFDHSASVDVIELLDDVVSWNRGVLAEHAQRPLEDPRVQLHCGNLSTYLTTVSAPYDTILIDIDNGPEAFTVSSNQTVYSAAGLKQLYQALTIGGGVIVWSAFRSPGFEARLRAAGFEARSVSVRARTGARKGARHTLFFGKRIAGSD